MKPIDYEYYDWLTNQISVPRNGKTYGGLFERMHNLEFVWTVPHDNNRVQDALDLRVEFAGSTKARTLALEGATILEVLVALSRRLAFIADGDEAMWAWRLIKNIRLNKMADVLTSEQVDRIDEVLYALVWRTYEPDGTGGFFPLQHPKEDQTKVELWYQMNAYVIEMMER